MKKGMTEVVMILDKSGSMHGLEADTIGGFNSMIEKQKKEAGEAIVSVVLFNERADVIYDRVDISKIEPMTDRQYTGSGCTALLDAVGRAIHHIKHVHKHSDPDTVPEKTLFIITTDGMENASREYTYAHLKKMIEKIVDDIERGLNNMMEKEIDSTFIGELVMERLKDLDEVAYVRFASVYRQFKDINTFMNELSKLLGNVQEK